MTTVKLLVLLFLFNTSLIAQGQWTLIDQALPLGRMRVSTHVSGSSWIAAGQIGICKTEDDGRTWILNSDTTIISVTDVAFSDGMNGIAIGDSIYRSTNSGWNWSVVKKPESPDSMLPTLHRVVWFNALEGLITTRYATYLRTTDGGATWERRMLEDRFRERIQAIGIGSEVRALIHTNLGVYVTEDKGLTWTFTDDTAANRGPISYSGRGHGIAFPAAGSAITISTYTSDAGRTWHNATTADSTTEAFLFASISGPRFALALSESGRVYVSRNGGAAWSFAGIASDGRQPRYESVSCREDGTGMITMSDAAMYRVENYGANIIPVGRPPRTESRCIVMPDRNTILIGGYKTIVRSTDRGKTWTTGTPSTQFNVRSIACANTKLMLNTSSGGELRRSTDGGITWELVTVPNRTSLDMAYFVNESIAIVVGSSGMIIRSTDAGVTWTEVQQRGDGNLYSVTRDARGQLHAVGIDGLICRSSDQGATWSSTILDSTQDLQSITFDAKGNGIIVSDEGSVFRTTNNGDTWAFVFNDITTPLRQVACRDDAAFVAGGSTVGYAGVILSTSDAGLTWDRTEYVRNRMRDIVFASPNDGVWISEEDGLFMYSGVDTTVSSVGNTNFNNANEPRLHVWYDAKDAVVRVESTSQEQTTMFVSLWGLDGKLTSSTSGEGTVLLSAHGLHSAPYFVTVQSNNNLSLHQILILK